MKVGQLRASHFGGDMHTAVGAAQLAAGHAVLFKPDSGNYVGHLFLIVDGNGIAGYQNNEDYVIDLQNAVHLKNLDAGDFI